MTRLEIALDEGREVIRICRQNASISKGEEKAAWDGMAARLSSLHRELITAAHEAPAEGAGEREAIIGIIRETIEADDNAQAGGTAFEDREETKYIYVDIGEFDLGALADAILALRARSSAPEAREGEAVACPHCDGPAKVMTCMGDWVGKGKGAHGGAYGPERWTVVCNSLYEDPIRDCPGRNISETREQAIAKWNGRTHPADPSADKLRIAVGEAEKLNAHQTCATFSKREVPVGAALYTQSSTDVSDLLRPFAEAADNLEEETEDASNIWETPAAMSITAGDLRRAAEALAALKAEGA